MDDLQQLLALGDGVVPGIEDLEIKIQTAGGLLGRGSLFDLIVVIVGGQRQQELQLLHNQNCPNIVIIQADLRLAMVTMVTKVGGRNREPGSKREVLESFAKERF